MKKILIFSLNYFPKYVGGAEVAVKEIVERQDKNNFEFHMLTLRFDSDLPKYELLHGIHIHRIGFTKKNATIFDLKNTWLKYNKYYFQLFAFLYAVGLHRKEKFSAIWAIMAHSCGVPAGIFKIFFPDVKYILNLQEGDPPEYIEKLARPFPKYLFFLNYFSFWFFKNAFLKADIIHSLSTYLNDWAIQMGNKGEKIIMPNAVNFKKFSTRASESDIKNIKNKFYKREGDIWIVTTSRLVPKNAVDIVIRSLKFLDEKIKFLVIGIGPEEENLRKLVVDQGLDGRVIFVGEVQNQDLVAYLNASDIFTRPSRSEGFGISFVEAMSAQLPVVATIEGGIRDFLFDGVTGWVCAKDNPESLANCVKNILEDQNKKEIILDNAFKMVREKYDWEIIGKRMEKEVFEKI